MNVVDWLLQDDAPGVQYLARLRLLGESPRSRRMTALRRRCNEYPPVARMLEGIDGAIACGNEKQPGAEFWGNYQKYRGAYWTLIFLAEMQADGRDPRIRALARHVLGTQLPNGGFSVSGRPRFEVVCITANILRSLVHFGFGHDDRVVRGYERLAERIEPHGGVPCIVLGACLHTSCKMTLPQTLRCLAVAPTKVPKNKVNKVRTLLVDQLLAVRVYKYRRPDAAEYHQTVRDRPQGVRESEIRKQWLREHTYRDDELLPKPGWLRFGFPRSYNPDLLEAMLSLVETGAKPDPVMGDALDVIETKRRKDGRWNLEHTLNGKMLADIERKGQPSKWITLRASIVLQHFGRLRL